MGRLLEKKKKKNPPLALTSCSPNPPQYLRLFSFYVVAPVGNQEAS